MGFDVLLVLKGMPSGQIWQVRRKMSPRLQRLYPGLITRPGLRMGAYTLGKAREKEEDAERKGETVCTSAFRTEQKRQSWPAAHADDK